MERIRAKQEKHRQGRAGRGHLQGALDPSQEPGECGQSLSRPCVPVRPCPLEPACVCAV